MKQKETKNCNTRAYLFDINYDSTIYSTNCAISERETGNKILVIFCDKMFFFLRPITIVYKIKLFLQAICIVRSEPLLKKGTGTVPLFQVVFFIPLYFLIHFPIPILAKKGINP
jgi:hypothetical protein